MKNDCRLVCEPVDPIVAAARNHIAIRQLGHMSRAEQESLSGLFVRSLFDRYHRSRVDTVIDTTFRVPGRPRTWGGTVPVRFT